MWEKILIFMIILNSFVLSQTFENPVDTTYGVTFQNIKIPSSRNIVKTAITKISNISAKIYDSNFNYIKDAEEIWLSPTKEELVRKVRASGGRGKVVQIYSKAYLQDKGNYFLQFDLSYDGETGHRTEKITYAINVDYPILATDVKLRESGYYYGEKLTFSFATLEFDEPKMYSYDVKDLSTGEIIKSEEQKSYVVLDDIFNEVKYLGKDLEINGYYQKNTFYKYRYKDDPTPQESKWQVKFSQPQSSMIGTWVTAKQPGVVKAISVENLEANKIYYLLSALAEDKYVVVDPKVRSVQVSAVTDFEGNVFKKSANVFKDGAYNVIVLEYEPSFLEILEVGGYVKVHTLVVKWKNIFNQEEVLETNNVLLIK